MVVDHCNGLLYSNPFIACASYFSVSLFIILSGYTVRITDSAKRRRTFSYQLKKVGRLYLQYAVATFILLIFYNRFFDLKTYVTHLLNFSIQAPYYFFLFFFQLLLVSSFLLLWCRFCSSRRFPIVWHLVTALFLFWFSTVLIRFTYILPVHGGGQYLFGGTYLFLYYLGILAAEFDLFQHLYKYRMPVLILSNALWIFWWLSYANGWLKFDIWFQDYLGRGFNPPGIQLMIFACITLMLLYSIFSFLEERASFMGTVIVDIFSVLGQHTLYTFMYHLLVLHLILQYFPWITKNKWLMRFGTFIPMVIGPVIVVLVIKKCKFILCRK